MCLKLCIWHLVKWLIPFHDLWYRKFENFLDTVLLRLKRHFDSNPFSFIFDHSEKWFHVEINSSQNQLVEEDANEAKVAGSFPALWQIPHREKLFWIFLCAPLIKSSCLPSVALSTKGPCERRQIVDEESTATKCNRNF
jgi:hypothetical protein